MDVVLLISGGIVGVLVGLTGMGSGSLITPLLIVVLGTPPTVAVGTNLVYGAVTKIAGSAVHARQGTIDYRLAARLSMASVPAGLGAVALVRLSPRAGLDADDLVRQALGVVLMVVAVVMLARMLGLGRRLLTPARRETLQGRGAPLAGGLVGATVGATSVGSGTLLVPYLAAVWPGAPAQVVGTDVFHAAVLMSVTGLAHARLGQVDWSVAAMLLAGSVPGVVLGGWMAPRLPVAVLRVSLAGLVLISGWALI